MILEILLIIFFNLSTSFLTCSFKLATSPFITIWHYFIFILLRNIRLEIVAVKLVNVASVYIKISLS